MATVSASAELHRVVFGVFRDGDNNLDAVQERNVTDFVRETRENSALKVVAEDTTGVARTPFKQGELRTEWSTIQSGTQHVVRIESPRDMSSRSTLAAFVARTLESRAADPAFKNADVWVDLVDHGAGDGGGLQSDSHGGACMPMEDIAGAIADGQAQFLKAHPGADASVTGVLANQCLMATLGFADALSRSGVRYLAASPETMLAPGAPSAKIADALTRGGDWASNVVDTTMQARYGSSGTSYHPAAAFDVLDLAPEKIADVRHDVATLNDSIVSLAARNDGAQLERYVRSDIRSVAGMARFDHTSDMVYHADRPAEAVYAKIETDVRLPSSVRTAASHAREAVGALVLAHSEYGWFDPMHASYADAAGPTEHLPISPEQYDPWADGGVSETQNGFFKSVHAGELARAIGAYAGADARVALVA
ncbi:MAG: hypothetical protein JO219_10330 [Candidatus Eremiobacteraeota bacterium]|nr:hypothetical protein [Candidatus Eremiobacteraeota bacterium]